MFDGLQDKLQDVFKRLRGEGTVTAEVLDAALREIRLALLDADVNIRVVRPFIARIKERATGEEVLGSLTPAQQVIKVVRDELIALLGEEGDEIRLSGSPPSVVMLCGLQGSGKTTTSGKIALRLKKKGRNPVLVACDLQRAAAVEQLIQVGAKVGVPVIPPYEGEDVLAVVRRALGEAKSEGLDTVILDTAGRLHIDDDLMDEVKQVATLAQPTETFFVADSMTGQDAVRSAEAFNKALPLTGVILSKLDGDARGGAALSIRTVADVPLRFLGTGEKPEDLDRFDPKRMASRILGMGDVLSLIEKAEEGLDAEESARLAGRIARQEFTLEDLRDHLRQMRKMGPLGQLIDLLPKAGPFKGLDPNAVDEKDLVRVEAIINSMTPKERRKPGILNARRKRRIARGSGTRVQDINRVLKQYLTMKKMLKGVKGKWMRRMMGS